MLTLKKIAVTGGMACGKSTVCHFFKEYGAYVVSADEIVHCLLSPSTEIGKEILQFLGPGIITDHNQFDRDKIADNVFRNKNLLKTMESIIHPAVKKAIDHECQKIANQKKYKVFVAEIPLLFESEYNDFSSDFNAIIAVISKDEISMKRFMKASGRGEETFYQRHALQMDPKIKAKRANYVINNDGSLEDLRFAVKELYEQFCKSSKI